MFVLIIMIVVSVVATNNDQRDPATDYILYFKEKTKGPVGILTTSSGAPISYTEASSTLNKRLINNEFFMDFVTHFTRENIPERVVHGKGTGAFGYFEVTHDISHICKANFLKKVGLKTPVVVRFSAAVEQSGGPDLNRDFRGFAIKFYTEEGNFDITGFNTPMFFTNDPLKFINFVHAAKRNPATNLFDNNSLWDMLTLLPEALHSFLLLFADRTTPASYRNMPGYAIHTYQVENECGDQYFVRFHILPDAGIKSLSTQEASNISATDLDYLTRDLFREIANGNFPSWTVSVQILTLSDVKKAGYRVFDITRVIPLNEYPLHPVGKIVLNRNAKNFHAEIEQLAFCPSNLVDGICGGVDKLYEARRLAYRDTQLYRLGANFKKIRVNCPFQVKTFTYNRDGSPPVKDNEGDVPNYYPNSFHGPVPYIPKQRSSLIDIVENKAFNFDQATELYVNELTTIERKRLIENFVSDLETLPKFLVERALKMFTIIHPDLAYRVAQGLNCTRGVFTT